MPFSFHEDRKLYFKHQYEVTKIHIIPFIRSHYEVSNQTAVLEIGCGEAGVLKAFTELECHATGVELHSGKYNMAKEIMHAELENGQLELINKNIYDEDFKSRFRSKFDLILLKDVIEHIPEQEKLLSYLHTFLKPDGHIFFAFPPWQMPFGGHQQMCKSTLKKIPYIHLFPIFIYKAILKVFGEKDDVVNGMLANKETGISIERFERILKKTGYTTVLKTHFLFNPIYKYKFNIEPKEQYQIISALPYLRNFLTTAVYYLIKPN